MTVIRPDLAGLPAYVPGTSVAGAVKLSSNEVSAPPPQGVLDAITRAATGVNRYPDIAVVELTQRLAARYGLSTERVAVGPGSAGLLQQLVTATCGQRSDEVLFAWRSFEAYPIVAQVGGARVRPVPLGEGFRLDLDAMAAALTPDTRLVLVCSPNNPTGPAVHRAEFERFLATVGPDVVVALDEAYAEYVTDPDAVDGTALLDGHPNLVVLRTFSKAYRLAGLRVGYALSSPELARALRQVCSPFGVSALAQAAALAALDHADELLAGCAEIITERDRVRAVLRAAGHVVPRSQANFVWLALRERSADFAAHCREQRVLIRPFPPDGVRVTISTPAENDLFLAAAASFPG